ncbi:MAG: L,D-transpeptidase, partial [Hyphomicrobiales bacterium]|nr:L,D-transpeptidase [Hyphomicrobiales bacterium]
APPAVVKRDHPELPNLIPGGSPRNPMGVAALTLNRDQIAIHGTTRSMRRSIGSAASYGCIRMYNEDVADLYNRVSVGTQVVMLR